MDHPRRRPPDRRRRRLAAPLLVLVVVAVGCGGSEPPDAASDSVSSEPVTTADTTDATAEPSSDAPRRLLAPVSPTDARRTGSLTTSDGRTRTWSMYVPSSLATPAAPLVIALHGGLGNGVQFADNSRLDGFAEANGFVVAYPDGIGGALGRDDLRTWNAGSCCGQAVVQQVDDVAFVRAMVDTLRADPELGLDGERVVALGHSNGGMMAHRLGCDAADLVAGVGSYGSSVEIEPCVPSQPVSVMAVHGTADTNHPLEGGRGNGVSGSSFAPVAAGIAAFAQADECSDEPETSTQGDLTTEEQTACDDGVFVRLVTIAGASHAWPGGTGPSAAVVGPAYADYDASFEIVAALLVAPR